jgi:pimeloyl-ACP methyl ester carboxylesterase
MSDPLLSNQAFLGNSMKRLFVLSVLALSTVVHAEDKHQYSFVMIDGNKLAYSCSGKGNKTVLLIEGMGLDAHKSFKNIYHNYQADGYQICMYDRAGVGASSIAKPRVRSVKELADELNAVVEANKWSHLILVAHSFGGFVARAYTHQYPAKVDGILFADSAHESWYYDMKLSMSVAGWKIMENIIEWEKQEHSHEDLVEAVIAAPSFTVPDKLPITVMSRGLPHNTLRQAKMSYADVDAYNAAWNSSQYKLLKLSSNAEHVTMHYSSHFVDENDPWLVLDELYKLQQRVEASSLLP